MGFNEIKGQDRVVKILRQAINRNHIAQAYLFQGPDGVGKKKAAICFAMALNCRTSHDDPCGSCISCRKIREGIHPDITVVKPDKGEIKIGVMRDLISGMVYRPLEAKKRLIIIDEAERLNLSASNAFLKTLEEPPVETVIILISSNPDMLPQTVLSRCQKVSFGIIPIPVITEILINERGYSRSSAESIASLSGGSIAKALSLSSDEVQQVRRDIVRVITKIYNARERRFDLEESFSKNEEKFYDALYWLYTFFRDVLILKNGGNSTLLINKDLYHHASITQEIATIDSLLEIEDFIRSIYKGQERNMNRHLSMNALELKILEEMVQPTGERYIGN